MQINITICVLIISLRAGATVTNLNEKLDAIDRLLSYARDELEIPGIAVGIVADGKAVFARGYGVRDLSDPKSYVTNHTLFALASCSKAFTTYALDILVNEDGVLKWSDPVINYIPEFRMKSEHATNCMKVKDLVTHASGLPRHDMTWTYTNFSMNEWLTRLPHLEPTYDLREIFQYNNIMYAVAGLVIERITGQSWEKVVQDRIFKPLNMTRSYTSLKDLYQKNVDNKIATPYSIPELLDKPLLSAALLVDVSVIGPAGSIFSSVEDMTNWIGWQLQLSGSSKEMHIPQITLHNYPTDDAHFAYGLGWGLANSNGRLRISHAGNIDGFSSLVALYPREKLGIVTLTNLDSAPNFIQHITDILSDAASTTEEENREWVKKEKLNITKRKNQTSSKWADIAKEDLREVLQPEEYTGNFENRGYGILEISYTHFGLVASFNDIRFALKARKTQDSFNAISPFPREFIHRFSFERDSIGDVCGVKVNMEPALPPILFEKQVDKSLYTNKYLENFVGSFQSDTRSVKIFTNDKSDLSIAHDSSDYSGNLKPIKRNWFTWEMSPFEFIAADGSRPSLEFNITIDGAVGELILHEEDSIDVLKKV